MDRDAPYDMELVLAVGAQVMLVANISVETGLANGSRGVVTGFKDDLTPLVKFMHSSVSIEVGQYLWKLEDNEGISRSQIPLKLAYALTIHKSQGATLDSALIDIGSNTFEYGQAYVALSRVKSLESLYVWDLEKDAFKAHPKVREYYSTV
jgi:ATP-dependent DNA helicase PIF1